MNHKLLAFFAILMAVIGNVLFLLSIKWSSDPTRKHSVTYYNYTMKYPGILINLVGSCMILYILFFKDICVDYKRLNEL